MKDLHKWKDEMPNRKNPLKVPEGYFEGFEEVMMKRIQSESTARKSPRMNRRLVYWVSGVAAALLIGVIGVQQFILNPTEHANETELIQDVVVYFAQDLDDISITNLLAEENILEEDQMHPDEELMEYMDVDDLALIEAIMKGY